MSANLATAYVTILPSMKGMRKGISSELGGAAEDGKKGFLSRIGGLVPGVGKVAGIAGGLLTGAIAGVAVTGGFNRAMQIEQAQAKLSGLGHDTKNVEKIMDNASAAVKGTAYGLGDAATVAASAVAAGVKPGQELQDVLTLVGDAASIAGTDMGSMGAIFNKVKASNKLQMDSINQLHDAGIPALALVAERLGVTAEEASKMASDGKIDFETFAAAMQEGMGGAAQKSGEVFTGALANTKAALGRIGETFLTPFLGAATTALSSWAIPALDAINAALKPIMAGVGAVLSGAVDLINSKLATVSEAPIVKAFGAIKAEVAAFEGDWYGLFTAGELGYAVQEALGVGENHPIVRWVTEAQILGGRIAEVLAGFKAEFALFKGDLYGMFAGGDLAYIIIEAFQLPMESSAANMIRTAQATVATFLGEMMAGFTAFSAAWSGVDATISSAGFPGFMEQAALRIRTSWEQLTGALSALVAGFMTGLSPALESLSGGFGGLVESAIQLWQSLSPVSLIFQALTPFAAELGQLLGTMVGVVLQLVAAIIPLGLQLASVLVPVISQIVAALLPALGEILGSITAILPSLVGIVEQVGAAFVALVAAIAPLVVQLVSALLPVVTQIVSAVLPALVQIVGAVVALLPALIPLFVMIADAVVQVISAVVPLVAELVSSLMPVITQLVTSVLPPVIAIFQALIPPILGLVTTIVSALVPVIQALLPIVTTVFQGVATVVSGVMQAVQGIIQTVMGVITGNWGMAWDGIKAIAAGVWDAIVGLVTVAIGAVLAVITTVLGSLKALWDTIWAGIKQFLANTWDGIKSTVSGAIDAVKGFIDTGLALISSAWDTTWSAIQTFAQTTWDTISSLVSTAMGAVGDTISIGLDALSSTWDTTWGNVKTMVSDAWESIRSAVSDGVEKVLGLMGDLARDMLDKLASVPRQMADMGRQIMQGLIDGIKEMAGAVGRVIGDSVGGAVNGAKSMLGIHSPSRVFKEIGVFTGEGLVLGLDSQADAVRRSGERMADAAVVEPPRIDPAWEAPAVPDYVPADWSGRGVDQVEQMTTPEVVDALVEALGKVSVRMDGRTTVGALSRTNRR